MKELHNHIFSNTTCISKEIMLKYINNQLSVKELHEMEKHLLDCEFCSEALEGLKYAENSSILFAIDNQIDQRVRMGGAKSPVIRNLMVAASILILFSVTYFTFDYFDGTVSNQSNLALKESTEKSVEVEESKDKDGNNIMDESGDASAAKMQNNTNSTETYYETEGKLSEINDDRIGQIEALSESPMEDADIAVTAEVDLLMEEVADEEEELSDRFEPQDVTVSMERAENESQNQPASTTATSSGASVSGNALKKKAESKSYDQENNRNKKDKRKAKGNKQRSMSPGYMYDTAIEEQKPLVEDGLTTVTLSSYKVVDYTDEYQQQFDLKNSIETTKSVSADFATEEDKEVAEKEKEELEVALTYKETLEKGMAYFKMDKYVQALEQFNIILKKHPTEVNCQFYGGLSYYRLDQHKNADGKFDQVLKNERKEFEEEAYWYKALTLIELSKEEEAKKILESIIKGKGFYAAQAEEKLKSL